MKKSYELWPTWDVPEITSDDLKNLSKAEEVKIYEASNVIGEGSSNKLDVEEKVPTPFEIKDTDFSALNRLLRVTTYVKRFIWNLKHIEKRLDTLSAEDIGETKMWWIKYIQKEVAEETTNDKDLEKKGIKYQLGLEMGKDGIIRCHGRLMNSDSVHIDAIYPIYIPGNCYFTTLLIRDVHNRLLHAGTAHTYHR